MIHPVIPFFLFILRLSNLSFFILSWIDVYYTNRDILLDTDMGVFWLSSYSKSLNVLRSSCVFFSYYEDVLSLLVHLWS